MTAPSAMPDPDEEPTGGTLVPFPGTAIPSGKETPLVTGVADPGTVAGELVTAEESAELDRRLPHGPARGTGPVRLLPRTRALVVTVATHQRTRRAGRMVVRNAGYAVAGSRIRLAERRARRKHLDLEQAITTLRVNGKSADDFRVLRELEDTLERRRTGQAQRGREHRIEVLRWTGGTLVVLACGHVVLLGYGVAQSIAGTGSVAAQWQGITDFWTTVASVSPLGDYWWGWALGGALGWAARCIPVGRARGTLPTWAGDTDPVPADGRSIIPDESAVLGALRHLGGLPALRQAFKEGWGTSVVPTWVQPPHIDGKGWRMQLVLPRGVPVEEIVKRKTVLAHNLVRLPIEVWPTEPKNQAGVLDLWVANPGVLSGPVEPWPLLHEGTTDYFAGVPLGVNIRGDLVTGRLSEANYAIAGIMGSGKSTLIITLIAGAILDPLVDVDVFVLAENADYDPFEPRLRTLRTGANPDTVAACVQTLRDLYAELEIRGKALKEHGERAVTRKLAEKDTRLRPRVMVIDECQALFMDAEYGEEAADTAQLLENAARKYAITVVFATPEASTASLPRKLMAVTSCKACFAIGDQQSNDAVLGTGSYKAGISAVSLEPKTPEGPGDIGTAMTRGIMGKPGLMRSFYLRKDAEVDEVTPIVERALTLRGGHDTMPGEDTGQADDVDFLADLRHVIGTDKRVRTMVLLSRLADHNPSLYGDWTSKTLKPALDDVEIPVRKSDGDSVVRADDVIQAITEREVGAVSDDDSDVD
ncbi:FtsK/SpoIIIE domain-containing protein [Actinokineospora terrae]|uniref:DNA segregation ATPase FtsK/SpoIIIE, S-DNA-T family n=1 Tax=Actinokineospora terrae TaxID=155974 RepID=A0A1H9VG49_9PSEU|nr:FtsK/SpoIIIE domain-containing protein [Actinokineospora terrae]SES20665.1 DNA segregation ATPase FtsK/SpoIIIE, S-DNA-T family [Actinokineospora terrae]